jgi:flagellar hook assembly protein FlgD
MDHLESIDLSSVSDPVEIPQFDKSQSRIGDIRKVNKQYQVHLFLDSSGRTHSIESHIEDMEGNVIKSFQSSNTTSDVAELLWDHTGDNKRQVEDGRYTWYVKADDLLHSGTINDNIS